MFGIYLADSLGYTGAVAVQLSKDVLFAHADRAEFLQTLSLILAGGGLLCLAAAAGPLLRRPGYAPPAAVPV